QGLSRPQCAPRLQVQGVHLRAEAADDATDQARAAKAVRRRAGDRPPQIRTPNGPQLPLAPRGRCRQCRPSRRRLQLPPPHQMAEAFAVRNPRSAQPRTEAHPSLKSQFFTVDDFAIEGAAMLEKLCAMQMEGTFSKLVADLAQQVFPPRSVDIAFGTQRRRAASQA